MNVVFILVLAYFVNNSNATVVPEPSADVIGVYHSLELCLAQKKETQPLADAGAKRLADQGLLSYKLECVSVKTDQVKKDV